MTTVNTEFPRARSRSPVKSTSTPGSPELQRKMSLSDMQRKMSESASDAGMGIPRPPSAADLRPNAYPYPIATTATGVLSRANSLSSPANGGKHHYVPPSPAREGSFGFDAGKEGSGKDGKDSNSTGKGREERRRAEYRGHRYSRSLSNSEDMYLPSSSPSASASNNGEYTGGGNAPRALPVPPGVSANSIAARNAAAAGSYSAYAASGTSPKRWTPAQLAAHLNTTGAPEAGAWAATRNVGGRAFMRMGEMGEEELRGMGAPPALRPAARALRQEVLASSSSTSLSSSSSVSDDEGTSNSPFRRGGSTSPTRPRVSAVYEEPGEIEDADGDADLDPQDDGTPSHRRRTMSVPVASPFANATSSSSPFAPKHKQSPFASRYEYPTNGDDGRGRASPSPSPSPTGRFRNGRVKGMVRSFESSGSESGSPERDRERGSGFRNVNASANGSGSGFRNEGGSGFLRRKASQSEGEDDDVGGTVRPHAHIQAQGTGSSGNGRALPVRPDSASAYGYGYSKAHVDVLDLGATVRGPVLVPVPMHAHGFLGTASSNGTGTTPQDKDQDEEELTVEELIAREDAVGGIGMGVGMSMGSMTPNHTGGAWRKGSSKRGLGVGMGMGMSPQSTGGSGNGNSIEGRHPTGGRPLPAHPTASSAAYAQHTQQRTSSGGVHAWEADEGATGSTVKWVPARAGVASHVFADVEGTDADADVGGKGGEGERIAEESEKDLEAEQERERVVEESEKDLEAERERERAAKNLAREEAHEKKKQQRAREAEAEERGRARGAAVRAQLAEAADLRTLVDAFRVRLEEVERKVGEMEAAADAKANAPAPAAAPTPATSATPNPSSPLTVTQRLDPRRLLALFVQTPGAAVQRNRNKREDWVGPTTITALPSYVLLVGLGVCAVVLRVLVKRGLGAVRGGARGTA